jgi:hypothetical protein
MTVDDGCEEWSGWIIPVDDEIDARVEALARRHEPTTGAKRPLRRDLSTPESRAFWASVTAASKAVAEWPEWKRLGVEDDE